MASRTRFVMFGLSAAAHLALGFGIGRMEIAKSHAATAIEIANVPKQKAKPPEPAKIDPVPPKPEPARARRAAAAPPAPAANTPPPRAVAAASPAMDALPDFGLSLSGGVGGDGIAIPSGPPAGKAPVSERSAPVRRALAAAPAPAAADTCDEPVVKPRARNVPQPAYTMEARTAGIEGKVRVKVTVDETGKVVEVGIVAGLGYGLDEAALAAAREATFEPATQCGKPVRATFNIAMRFSSSG